MLTSVSLVYLHIPSGGGHTNAGSHLGRPGMDITLELHDSQARSDLPPLSLNTTPRSSHSPVPEGGDETGIRGDATPSEISEFQPAESELSDSDYLPYSKKKKKQSKKPTKVAGNKAKKVAPNKKRPPVVKSSASDALQTNGFQQGKTGSRPGGKGAQKPITKDTIKSSTKSVQNMQEVTRSTGAALSVEVEPNASLSDKAKHTKNTTTPESLQTTNERLPPKKAAMQGNPRLPVLSKISSKRVAKKPFFPQTAPQPSHSEAPLSDGFGGLPDGSPTYLKQITTVHSGSNEGTDSSKTAGVGHQQRRYPKISSTKATDRQLAGLSSQAVQLNATDDVFEVPAGSPKNPTQTMSLRSRVVKNTKTTRVNPKKKGTSIRPAKVEDQTAVGAEPASLNQSVPSNSVSNGPNSGKKKSPVTYSSRSRVTKQKVSPRSRNIDPVAKATASEAQKEGEIPRTGDEIKLPVKNGDKLAVTSQSPESPTKKSPERDAGHIMGNTAQIRSHEIQGPGEPMLDALGVADNGVPSVITVPSDHSSFNISSREHSPAGVTTKQYVDPVHPIPPAQSNVTHTNGETSGRQSKTERSVLGEIQDRDCLEPRGPIVLDDADPSDLAQRKRKARIQDGSRKKQLKTVPPPQGRFPQENTDVIPDTPVHYNSRKEKVPKLFTIYEDHPAETRGVATMIREDHGTERATMPSLPNPAPVRDVSPLVGDLVSPIQSRVQTRTVQPALNTKWSSIQTPLQDIPIDSRRLAHATRERSPKGPTIAGARLPWKVHQPGDQAFIRQEKTDATAKLSSTLYGIVDVGTCLTSSLDFN